MHTLFPGIRRLPKQFTSTKSKYFRQLMTFALLDSEVERHYLMTNFNESYLAGQWFDITTPGLKTDYRSAALPIALPGPVNMRTCMYICVLAQMCAYLSMHVRMRETDAWTDRGWRDWWI